MPTDDDLKDAKEDALAEVLVANLLAMLSGLSTSRVQLPHIVLWSDGSGYVYDTMDNAIGTFNDIRECVSELRRLQPSQPKQEDDCLRPDWCVTHQDAG